VQEVRYSLKIEEFHRELKQLTGVEAVNVAKCAFNAITLPVLCWFGPPKLSAYQTGTIYQIKHGMLSDYLIEQPKHPSIQMSLA